MKAAITSLIILVSALAFWSVPVYAVNILPSCTSSTDRLASSDVCQAVNSQTASGKDPIISTIRTVISVLGYIIGTAAVIVLIIGGIQMVTGGGNPKSVADARNMIIYALVGILVAVLAQVIVIFVLNNVV